MHARWRPEVALAGVVEQHPQSAEHKLGRTRHRRGTDADRRKRRVADTALRATDCEEKCCDPRCCPPPGVACSQGERPRAPPSVRGAWKSVAKARRARAFGIRCASACTVAGTVELMDHGDVDDQVSLVADVGIPDLEVTTPSPAAGGDVWSVYCSTKSSRAPLSVPPSSTYVRERNDQLTYRHFRGSDVKRSSNLRTKLSKTEVVRISFLFP